MDRFEQNAPATLELKLRVNGVLTDATGDVGVVVRDGAATQVVAGNATKPVGTTGTYQFQLTAASLATLDVFERTWSYTQGGQPQTRRRRFRTVGSFYCTIDELRTFDDGVLADTEAYPDQKLINYRELAEEFLERQCDLVFSPQGKRVALHGTGELWLDLPTRRFRRFVSGSIDGVALTAAQVASIKAAGSRVHMDDYWTRGVSNVVAFFEHGYDEPPEEIREATKRLVRSYIVPSSINESALTVSDDLGTRRLDEPGPDRPSGIPYVDAVIEDYKEEDEIGSVQIVTGR